MQNIIAYASDAFMQSQWDIQFVSGQTSDLANRRPALSLV
jgi:hypothetical protein